MGKVDNEEAMNHNEIFVCVCRLFFVCMIFNSYMKFAKFGVWIEYNMIVDIHKSRCSWLTEGKWKYYLFLSPQRFRNDPSLKHIKITRRQRSTWWNMHTSHLSRSRKLDLNETGMLKKVCSKRLWTKYEINLYSK